MRTIIGLVLMLASAAGATAQTSESNLAKPNLLIQLVVTGMPKGEKQEVRVLTATFRPGDKTVYHDFRAAARRLRHHSAAGRGGRHVLPHGQEAVLGSGRHAGDDPRCTRLEPAGRPTLRCP
jgi:hypothetical protein